MAYHVGEPAEGMSDDWMYHTPDQWTNTLDQHEAQQWAHELELQQEEREMAFTHEEGRGSGWTNHSENPKAPKLKGSLCWKGEQINWALWKNPKRKDTDPDWGLKLEEPRESGGGGQSYTPKAAPQPAPKVEDDFPF